MSAQPGTPGSERGAVERSGFLGDPPPWDQRPTFALDADVTVYWPAVRPCWEER